MTVFNDDYSRVDVAKSITTPDEITPKLAELIGVVIGDGHVTYTSRNRKEYEVCISGSREDFEKHHKTFVIPAFKELFNAEPYVRFRRKDECETAFRSKLVASFFHKKLGIPGNKKNVSTPVLIKNGSVDMKISFLRGLFDTDGHFCLKKKDWRSDYPVIGFSTISTPLFEDVKSMLRELDVQFSAFDFKSTHKGYDTISIVHKIEISGRNNVFLWLEKIGFSNGKYNDKIREWTRRELNARPLDYQSSALPLLKQPQTAATF